MFNKNSYSLKNQINQNFEFRALIGQYLASLWRMKKVIMTLILMVSLILIV